MESRKQRVQYLILGVLAVLMLTVYFQTRTIAEQTSKMASRVDLLSEVIQGAYGHDLETVLGAIKEGKVTIYTAVVLAPMEEVAEAFKKRYPFIKEVEIVRAPSATIYERFRSEAAGGLTRADIFNSHGVGFTQQQIDEGIFAQYVPADSARLEAGARLEPYAYADGSRLYGLVYNTNNLTKEEIERLKDWKGLLDPKYKGRIAMMDPKTTGAGYYFLYMWKELYGDDFIKALAEQKVVHLPGSTAVTDQVIKGEYLIGISLETATIQKHAEGAPVGWISPDPTPSDYRYHGITANAPHPNAAKLFMDFLTSAEGQLVYQEANGTRAVHELVADTRSLPKTKDYIAPPKTWQPKDSKQFIDADFQKSLIDSWMKLLGL